MHGRLLLSFGCNGYHILKRLVALLSASGGDEYSVALGWLQCCLSFSLLCSAIQCRYSWGTVILYSLTPPPVGLVTVHAIPLICLIVSCFRYDAHLCWEWLVEDGCPENKIKKYFCAGTYHYKLPLSANHPTFLSHRCYIVLIAISSQAHIYKCTLY